MVHFIPLGWRSEKVTAYFSVIESVSVKTSQNYTQVKDFQQQFSQLDIRSNLIFTKFYKRSRFWLGA